MITRPTKEELKENHVDYPYDTDFAAHARLLQSKWRQKKNLPEFKLGSSLDIEFAKSMKANFLTENIQQLVTQEVASTKKNKSMISEPRIWNNLLSSQPLCFNLFGELYYNLELATFFFRELFPKRVEEVTSIKFEYSAGRGNNELTGDHSAFDVFIEYVKNNKKGFIGIEVKYSESLKEESKKQALYNYKNHRIEYEKLTTSDIFSMNAIDKLKLPPLSQIWRDHLLSIAHLHLKDYDEGFFVFLYPEANIDCQNGVEEYRKFLVESNEVLTGFYPRYLDDFIRTLRKLHDVDWTKELEERYLGK